MQFGRRINSKKNHCYVLLSFVLCSLFPYPLFAQNSDAIATIEKTQGFTAIQREGQWHIAQVGDKLANGDRLYSGDKSRIQFDFVDGTTTTLGEFSNFNIDNYQWSELPAEQQQAEAEFSLNSGVFRIITGQITQVESPRFAVNTPLASIGIRGTDFWGGYLDSGKIDVFFVEGEHAIEITGQGQTAILDNPTQGVTFSEDGEVSEVVFWGQAKIERAVNTVTFDN